MRTLYRRLQEDGIDAWLDEERLLPGQDWEYEIRRAVRASDAIIICLSQQAVTKSGYVQKEIRLALDVADEQPEGSVFLIPLKLEDCDVPDRLLQWQWVQLNDQHGYDRLMAALDMRARTLGLDGVLANPTPGLDGMLDNPWRQESLRRRIAAVDEDIDSRVLGQHEAVTKTLDILKRAVLGLSGAEGSRGPSGPRVAYFFAGPSGVGKTELAKAISAMVFGDQTAFLRFDMSDYASEPSGDRLTMELASAVHRQPFRLILFDQIEKAHPRILDKFVQILDKGQISNGLTATAYFSESILVFASNLGIVVYDSAGEARENAVPGMPYDELESRVKSAISHHFVQLMRRPDLFNRLRDKIVVFDFIDRDVHNSIFEGALRRIIRRHAEQYGIALTFDEQVEARLRSWCTADPSRGGRGVLNAFESYLVNPLYRALFHRTFTAGDSIRVTGIQRDAGIVSLELDQ